MEAGFFKLLNGAETSVNLTEMKARNWILKNQPEPLKRAQVFYLLNGICLYEPLCKIGIFINILTV
ncbi:hypothetical protein OKW24_004519 [Peribacillus simplex]|nr:hypothetical protein [Peribacillus simplex]